jgi:hypothetical protein
MTEPSPGSLRALRKEAQARRLAAALKSNLRRRKIQARARAAEGDRGAGETAGDSSKETPAAPLPAAIVDDKRTG